MTFQWWSIIPFALMLLSIAIFPLMPATRHRWESHGVQLALALVLGIPVAAWMWFGGEHATVLHSVWEYLQFVILLGSLFTISGGIFLAGDLRATPRTNTAFLAAGSVLASFIGTTGAAMLLIRPILNTNRERLHRRHTVIFAILTIANTGGLLTPLGDPPLFLGMLRGVPFTWTFSLFPEWLFVNGLLLLTYYGMDRRLYSTEDPESIYFDDRNLEPLRVRGAVNFAWLALVVVAVAFLPSLDLTAIEEGHATAVDMVPWRELAMLAAAALSLTVGSKSVRYERNEFSWGPILEVAALFIGIFLTMMPALKFLAQVAPKLHLNEVTLYLFTGGLSSVLDNAPTYATFFEMAKTLPGDPRVADVPELYLASISLGAVLWGAMTYIGNGPNFMVKAVSESRGVDMPSFGGYVVWTVKYLLPVLLAVLLVFIADGVAWRLLGWAITLLLVGRAFWIARRGSQESRLIEAE